MKMAATLPGGHRGFFVGATFSALSTGGYFDIKKIRRLGAGVGDLATVGANDGGQCQRGERNGPGLGFPSHRPVGAARSRFGKFGRERGRANSGAIGRQVRDPCEKGAVPLFHIL